MCKFFSDTTWNLFTIYVKMKLGKINLKLEEILSEFSHTNCKKLHLAPQIWGLNVLDKTV